MSQAPAATLVPVLLSLTDEELLALGSMTGRLWPRPLHAVVESEHAKLQAGAGVRSLQARGLLEPELPEVAADIMGAVLAVFAEPPASLTVAVTDAQFIVDPEFPVLEALLLPDRPLAVSSLTPGVHTFRAAALDEILDSFADWVVECSLASSSADRQVTAFARDGQGSGVAGAVLAPGQAILHQVPGAMWAAGGDATSASPRERRGRLVQCLQPSAL